MTRLFHVAWVLVVLLAGNAGAAITIDTVRVGNPGNAADTRYASPGYGSVAYDYRIGKYEVTAGQYCEFLNAVARTDIYGLYDGIMDYDAYPEPRFAGCNIKRMGVLGSYSYSVSADWANRPVNWVSWADAARFANWLTNGQPTGNQSLLTTEDGSYFLNGATTGEQLMAVTRKANARYVVPTEDEWYKAAYYDPAKPDGAGYWDYPTRSNTPPSNILSPTGSNNANYNDVNGTGNGGCTIDAPYYRTEVGAFAGSSSAYGTFDQGGNVWEWNEASLNSSYRVLRGGGYIGNVYGFLPEVRSYCDPAYATEYRGFRIVEVPEPGSFALLALSSLAMMRKRR